MKSARIFVFVPLLLLCGCASWFGSSERPRYPPDATVYKCDGGKELVVRYVDNGKSAMIVYPEREFRLDSVPGASGVRYTNGRTTLLTKGENAVLEEGGQNLFAECAIAR
jgi:membrane-bound inhibitor of C-type lysozyme